MPKTQPDVSLAKITLNVCTVYHSDFKTKTQHKALMRVRFVQCTNECAGNVPQLVQTLETLPAIKEICIL